MAGGGAGNNQVVFGAWSAQANKFMPCLTVADNGAVTVNGNLVVNGQIKQGNVVPGKTQSASRGHRHVEHGFRRERRSSSDDPHPLPPRR